MEIISKIQQHLQQARLLVASHAWKPSSSPGRTTERAAIRAFPAAPPGELPQRADLAAARRFILRPFTVPIATSAIKYTLHKDDYIFEAAADLNKQAPYLSVQKRHGRQVCPVLSYCSFLTEGCGSQCGGLQDAQEVIHLGCAESMEGQGASDVPDLL